MTAIVRYGRDEILMTSQNIADYESSQKSTCIGRVALTGFRPNEKIHSAVPLDGGTFESPPLEMVALELDQGPVKELRGLLNVAVEFGSQKDQVEIGGSAVPFGQEHFNLTPDPARRALIDGRGIVHY
jgi:hypothetical protein